jgi:dGTPase
MDYGTGDERAARYWAGVYQKDEHEYRSPMQVDRDRVLYSLGFRRLGDITQVASSAESQLVHNRLTHSLKVAQVGRRLTESLQKRFPVLADSIGLDPDVTETAGLAHDLGHPPFGHVAEGALDRAAQCSGGFDGNAHTFRIVTRTGFKKPTSPRFKERPAETGNSPYRTRLPGLDLTRASLRAILKYPLPPGSSPVTTPTVEDRAVATKPGIYASEKRFFSFARAHGYALEGYLDPIAILMDWADDISYAVHDVEDHVRAKLMPLDYLQHDPDGRHQERVLRRAESRLQNKGMASSEESFERSYEIVRESFPKDYDGSVADEYRLQEWMSARIGDFERAVRLADKPPFVHIAPAAVYEIEILKAITWEFVINAPLLAAAQQGQIEFMTRFYHLLCDWVTVSPGTVPMRLLELTEFIKDEDSSLAEGLDITPQDYATERGVLDFIVSLTERQAVDLFQRISGLAPANIFGSWLR